MRIPLFVSFLLVVLTACSASAPTATVTPMPSPLPSPSSTETPVPPTATAMPTATPEYPAINSPDIKLPANHSENKINGVWYIVDNDTKTAIYRFPEGAQNWQARNDVTIGETTYEGWVTFEGSAEITGGVPAKMDANRSSDMPGGYSSVDTGVGYLIYVKEIEAVKGPETMVVTYFTMQYNLPDGRILLVDHQADRKKVERRGFDISKSLGKPFNIVVLVPTKGGSFPDELKARGVELNKLNGLQQEFGYHGGFIDPNDLLSLLNNPPESNYIDLTSKVSVGSFIPALE
jgi:hypothetical protein